MPLCIRAKRTIRLCGEPPSVVDKELSLYVAAEIFGIGTSGSTVVSKSKFGSTLGSLCITRLQHTPRCTEPSGDTLFSTSAAHALLPRSTSAAHALLPRSTSAAHVLLPRSTSTRVKVQAGGRDAPNPKTKNQREQGKAEERAQPTHFILPSAPTAQSLLLNNELRRCKLRATGLFSVSDGLDKLMLFVPTSSSSVSRSSSSAEFAPSWTDISSTEDSRSIELRVLNLATLARRWIVALVDISRIRSSRGAFRSTCASKQQHE